MTKYFKCILYIEKIDLKFIYVYNVIYTIKYNDG